jgi:heme/copper-type cytochrome/quinol oxidase subunit 2
MGWKDVLSVLALFVLPKFKSQKGVSELIPVGLAIGVFAIVLAVVALILAEFQTQMTANSFAYNITQKGLEALWTIAKFLGIIALALIGGYLIFVLVRQFRGGGGAA